MKIAVFLGFAAAVLFHSAVLLFGGLLFPGLKQESSSLTQVELLSEEVSAEKEPEKEPETKPEVAPEQLEATTEQPPDAEEIIRNLEQPANNDAPALEAASLSAIESALSGQSGAGGGDFAQAIDFSSGGRIGGTGKAGEMDQKMDEAFSMAEIDQSPRAVLQGAPMYPAQLRGKKIEGVVTVLFVVEATGKVSNPRVEKSSHAAFEKPALDAVRKWKFEPAVRAGASVACKMRVPIRFQPN